MPPSSEPQNSVPPVVPPSLPTTPSTAIKAIRIFLLVLIIIGLGLIASYKLWVPELVNAIVPPPTIPLVTPSGNQLSLTTTQKITNAGSLDPADQVFTWVPISAVQNTTSIFSENDGKIYIESGNLIGASSTAQFLDADPTTFVVAVSKNGYATLYAKDKNHVYYSAQIVEGDPATFAVLADIGEEGGPDANWSKDKNHVYYAEGNQTASNADPATFMYLGNGLLKDKNNIYGTNGGDVALVDVPTFVWVGEDYFKDKNHVYRDNGLLLVMQGVDPVSFVVSSTMQP